ncbi:hypothetical protein GA0116948_101329 [Chitinophaga costaii]|uniref:Uncharacterized protein n=1 Tax=Chitinophaga costaii TaxID=1335309 RepID=A0A1C3ZC23_9BACT|nr:hypothetical protein GA0116948_101329 [Chitinophaga costaii]
MAKVRGKNGPAHSFYDEGTVKALQGCRKLAATPGSRSYSNLQFHDKVGITAGAFINPLSALGSASWRLFKTMLILPILSYLPALHNGSLRITTE